MDTLPVVWGAEESGSAPFDDAADAQWFVDAVMARYNEIVRDLGRGKLQPIFDIDERNGDVLWEMWIDGFAQAMALRSDSWAALADGDDDDAVNAVSHLSTLIAVARNESSLDSVEINAVHDEAPADLVANVVRLHASRLRSGSAPLTTPPSAQPPKVGRNEPCPCGSGEKFKRCCG